MDRRYKGRIGEQKVILRALEKGWQVNVPVVAGRYDLILDDGKRLYKVQVKYTDTPTTWAVGSVVVGLMRRGRSYAVDEVDLLLVYIPKLDRVLAFQPSDFCGKSAITVRLEPAKNNQSSGVKLAKDYFW